MAKEINSYKVIGVMAGSSMDGLDVVVVDFRFDEKWTYQILEAETISYNDYILNLLTESPKQNVKNQQIIDWIFGEWIGEKLQGFVSSGTDLIGLHGHTVSHDPKNGVSWQLGRGDVVAEVTNIKTVSNFRSKDVSLGGQGAPLVPIGDFELFEAYDACLNLGGIANVSVKDRLLAWDVCPCNQVLNFYAQQLGQEYDDKGGMARQGELRKRWVRKLESIDYFNDPPPKSLGNHFISEKILSQVKPEDGLRSYNEFLCNQILGDLESYLPDGATILVTGGGAYNDFLLDLLNSNESSWVFERPDNQIVAFKEALIFAFLAVKKLREETNVLSSVTGATSDSSSGVVHDPK